MGFARPEVTVGMTKAADGKTDLYYRVVKPTNMEEGKRWKYCGEWWPESIPQ